MADEQVQAFLEELPLRFHQLVIERNTLRDERDLLLAERNALRDELAGLRAPVVDAAAVTEEAVPVAVAEEAAPVAVAEEAAAVAVAEEAVPVAVTEEAAAVAVAGEVAPVIVAAGVAAAAMRAPISAAERTRINAVIRLASPRRPQVGLSFSQLSIFVAFLLERAAGAPLTDEIILAAYHEWMEGRPRGDGGNNGGGGDDGGGGGDGGHVCGRFCLACGGDTIRLPNGDHAYNHGEQDGTEDD